ncbi:MAG: Exodeoxyribonuclease [Frankiales bacterium]|nr:Exodeoxyribonuclease [Frankiales bacterium]
MRIATWNVNSITARLPRFNEWLELADPDVVCLQETKTASFPSDRAEELGYEVAHNGDGRWNGVAILSRVGLEDVSLQFEGQPGYANDDEDALLSVPKVEARAVGATCGGVRVWSLYVPNGRALDSAHFPYKLEWLDRFRDVVAAEQHPLVVTGDFNIAPTDDDVWDIKAFAGSTHVTADERARLTALLDCGLVDVVPRPQKYDKPFTYYDYRAGMFHKNMGMRIDLFYASPSLTVLDAYIDRDARKGTGPSDHCPVVVDLSP